MSASSSDKGGFVVCGVKAVRGEASHKPSPRKRQRALALDADTKDFLGFGFKTKKHWFVGCEIFFWYTILNISAIQHLWQLSRCCGTTVTLLWDNRHAVMRQLSHNADSNHACFQGFSCCDASLRHEGCFFSAAGLPKLASEQAGYGEETTGVALASQQGFYWFLLQ